MRGTPSDVRYGSPRGASHVRRCVVRAVVSSADAATAQDGSVGEVDPEWLIARVTDYGAAPRELRPVRVAFAQEGAAIMAAEAARRDRYAALLGRRREILAERVREALREVPLLRKVAQ